MKVIILAGGFGSRLGNLTESVPKPMLRVGEKPILWHIMKIYDSFGFNDFIVNLGYKSEIIKHYFASYHFYQSDFLIHTKNNTVEFLDKKEIEDWNVALIDTGLNTLKGARLKRIEKYLDDINMLTYGDGVADINISDLVEFHKKHGKMVTISGVNPPARFGELIEENNLLVSFHEKPQISKGLINGGFMVFNKTLSDYLTEDELCDLESGVLENLAKAGEVMIYKHSGHWACVDTERELQYLNELWNKNKAFWKVW